MMRAWMAPRSPRWLDELDVVGPRWRASVWAWAVLVLGLAMGLNAWLVVEAVQTEHQAAQEEVDRLTRAEQRVTRAVSTAPAPALTSTTSPTAAPVLEPAGWRRAAELAQALARDWPALLDSTALEAAEQKMLLTQWSLDPEGQVLSLQAWARDDDSPLVWLGTMGPQAELQSRERLTTPVDTRWGAYVWRVQVRVPQAKVGEGV